jgi:hypothetical protein
MAKKRKSRSKKKTVSLKGMMHTTKQMNKMMGTTMKGKNMGVHMGQ